MISAIESQSKIQTHPSQAITPNAPMKNILRYLSMSSVPRSRIESQLRSFGNKAIIVPLFLSTFLNAFPTAAAPIEPAIAERGPHHRVWRTVTSSFTQAGREIYRTNSYTELATGMHYFKDGTWQNSKEEIELFEGGAVARQGQHSVIFLPNINTAGAIDLLAVDGNRFRSHILGVAYTDAATGQNTLIASIKDSIGQLVAPNQIIYPDAFTDFKADVRYTYTKDGFEQDIILRENPPSPAEYGMNPDTTRLEVWTEFIDPPAPVKELLTLRQQPDPAIRASMAEPDFTDEILKFGAMSINTGSAFPLENNPAADVDPEAVQTGKTWQRRAGRDFLIERVEYPAIKNQLEILPKPQARINLNKDRIKNMAKADPAKPQERLIARQFPTAPPKSRGVGKIIRTAGLRPSSADTRPGYVLDYITMASATNWVFKGDTTYLLDGNFTLSQTTTIEAGTVIKLTTNQNNRFLVTGPIDCQTTSSRPAVFTAKDDNTYGETISGSTGSPNTTSFYYGARTLHFFSTSSSPYNIHDLRIFYVKEALYLSSGNTLNLSHAVIAYGLNAFNNSGAVSFRNGLVYLEDAVFANATGSTNSAENLTAHKVSKLRTGTSTISLTNCLLIAVTNNVSISGVNNYTNQNDSGIFQTAGACAHYLAAGSPHRNAGTTAINSSLVSDLKQRTTYPPLWLTNNITIDTTLYPQAQRDTDTPDLGFHPEAVDYLVSGVTISGVALTLTNGVVIGVDSSISNYGFRLDASSTIVSEGSAANLNRFVRTHTIGELSSASGSSPATFTVNGSAYSITARFRFTDFPMLAGPYYDFYSAGTANWNINNFTAQDSQFRGGNFYVSPSNPSQTFNLLNNLFERVNLEIRPYAAITLVARNNLFKDGALNFSSTTSSNNHYTVFANLFDRTAITQSGLTVGNWNNGYVTNCTTLSGSDGGDVITNSPAYETSWLGKYYLPTNSLLINAGDDQADVYGLYHCTVLANQTKETNSVADIGFHYVATDSYGVPLDIDGDGIADYLEDYNGNGSVDSGETDWQTYNSLYGVGSGPGLQVFTPLK